MMTDYEQYPVFEATAMHQPPQERHTHSQMSPPSAYPYMLQQNLHHQQVQPASDSQASHLHITAATFSLDPSQLRPSSVGPSRVVTRRQARLANAQADASHAFTSPHETQINLQGGQNEGLHMFSIEQQSISRPESPNSFQQQRFNTGALSVCVNDLGSIFPNSSAGTGMSPTHPGTPLSSTSSAGFTHYGFNSHGSASMHSRSGSNATYPRSASPAMSSISVTTSISEKDHMCPPLSRGSDTSAPSSAASSNASGSERPTRTKRRLSNYDRKDICQYACAHPNARQEDIAKRWDVERSTVSKILKNRYLYLNLSTTMDNFNSKFRVAKFPRLERKMEEWLKQQRDKGAYNVTDNELREKAREIAKEIKLSEDKFKASAGWVENFKHRNNIVKGVIKPTMYHTYNGDDPWLHQVGKPMRKYRKITDKTNATILMERHGEAEVIPIPEEIRASANIVNVNLAEPHSLPDGFLGTRLCEEVEREMKAKPHDIPDHQYTLPSDTPEIMHFANQYQMGFYTEEGRLCQTIPPPKLHNLPNLPLNDSPVTPQDASKAFDVAFLYIRQHKLAAVTDPIVGVLSDIQHELRIERHKAEKDTANHLSARNYAQPATELAEVTDDMTHGNPDEHVLTQAQT